MQGRGGGIAVQIDPPGLEVLFGLENVVVQRLLRFCEVFEVQDTGEICFLEAFLFFVELFEFDLQLGRIAAWS